MDYESANTKATANRRETFRLQREWELLKEETVKALDKDFKAAWKAAFPNVYAHAIATFFLSDSGGASFGVYLYNLGRSKTGRGDICFLPNGGYGVQDPDDEHHYLLATDEAPVTWEALMDFISKFEESHLGAKIQIVQGKVRDHVEAGAPVRNLREIELMHPRQTVVLVGRYKKWYQGWDIPDHAILVTIDDVKWAWWSTDAHGGAMDNKACEGSPEWASFEEWVKEADGA